MARIRHIALVVKDLEKTATFYQKALGLSRSEMSEGPTARRIYMSDGEVNLALLQYKSEVGSGLKDPQTFVGVHHFGILVDDLEDYQKKLEEMGAPCFMKQDPDTAGSYYETKFRGPDGVVFDLSEHPWVGSAPAGVAEVKVKETEPAE